MESYVLFSSISIIPATPWCLGTHFEKEKYPKSCLEGDTGKKMQPLTP